MSSSMICSFQRRWEKLRCHTFSIDDVFNRNCNAMQRPLLGFGQLIESAGLFQNLLSVQILPCLNDGLALRDVFEKRLRVVLDRESAVTEGL